LTNFTTKFTEEEKKEEGKKHQNEETTWIGYGNKVYSISRTSEYRMNINSKDTLDQCDFDM